MAITKPGSRIRIHTSFLSSVGFEHNHPESVSLRNSDIACHCTIAFFSSLSQQTISSGIASSVTFLLFIFNSLR